MRRGWTEQTRRAAVRSWLRVFSGVSVAAGVGAGLLAASNGRAGVFDPKTGRLVILAGCLLSTGLTAAAWRRWLWRTTGKGFLRPVSATLGALLPALSSIYVALPQVRATEKVFVSAPPATPAAADRNPSGRVNVLLLGGDAGEGRWGLRTDSINVVSVDLKTRAAVIIGVPRNLYNAPMPAGPLTARFPKGFPGLINAQYTWAMGHTDAVIEALGPTEDPGASLVAASVAEFTGLRLDGWVLTDLKGFIDIVDVLGGVEIHVSRRISLPGNVGGAKHATRGHLDAGWHHLDGTDALSYSRSRHDDSDYARMRRQRCVLVNLAAQHLDARLLTRWSALAGAISGSVRTNLSAELLNDLVTAASRGLGEVRTLSLAPPTVPNHGWDLDEVRNLVGNTISGKQPTPSSPSRGAKLPAEPSDSAPVLSAGAQDEECLVRR